MYLKKRGRKPGRGRKRPEAPGEPDREPDKEMNREPGKEPEQIGGGRIAMDRYYEELRVRVHAEEMGTGLCVTVSGGDRAHIGSVAMAEPRPSLTGDGSGSATVSVHNWTGHKDGEVAEPLAQRIASRLGRRTVVVCGLHYEGADAVLFKKVEELTERIAAEIEEQFGEIKELFDAAGRA